MSSRELYQKTILEHNKKSRNEGVMESPTHYNKSYNPFCGDEIDMYLEIKDGIIVDIKHKAMGCSISRASTSMMSEAVKGKTLNEAKMIFDDFHKLVTGGMTEDEALLKIGKLSVFSGIWNYPARIKCAILAWHSLVAAMDGKKEMVIEDK